MPQKSPIEWTDYTSNPIRARIFKNYEKRGWLCEKVSDGCKNCYAERINKRLGTGKPFWVSYEPALGPVDFTGDLGGGEVRRDLEGETVYAHRYGIDWIVCGGESGPGARPFAVNWARSAIAQCRAAGVPVFVKQLGRVPIIIYDRRVAQDWIVLKDRKGGDMAEWPEDLRVREYPR